MNPLDEKFTNIYHKHYNRIPNDFEGGLLMEAVNESYLHGDKCNQLVEAYQMGQRDKAITLLWELLDDYRSDVAVRETRQEMNNG